MSDTSYALLTLRRTAVERITFPDGNSGSDPVIVRSGEGEDAATRQFAERLSRNFDADVMPLLRDPRLVAGRVADVSRELARLDALAADWLAHTAVQQAGNEVQISVPDEPQLRCRIVMEKAYEYTVMLSRVDNSAPPVLPRWETLRLAGQAPRMPWLLERAAEIVRWLNPHRSRLEQLRSELDFLGPVAARGTTPDSPDAVDALFSAWALTQAATRPVVDSVEGWELRRDGVADPTSDSRHRLFLDDPTGDWPANAVLAELNNLAREGWRVVSVTEDKRVAGTSNEPMRTRYLLERTS